MTMLERQKTSEPTLSKSFNSLVQCLRTGIYAKFMKKQISYATDLERGVESHGQSLKIEDNSS